MRIAVVGSGISGLSASYLLAPHAEVTLFESAAELGGHTHTEDVTLGGKPFAVDTGFMVYNPRRYPYLIALLKELGVESTDTVMSFSVSVPGEVEYSSSYAGLFGNTKQLMRPAFWRLLYDILRFNRLAKRFLDETAPGDATLLRDFVTRYGFSRQLVEWYRFPMLGSIWSAASGDIDAYPARETFRFLDNHLLLNVFNKPTWRTVRGGSREYVRALERVFAQEGVAVRTASPVTTIRRTERGVEITTASGTEPFDHVVVATHADTALSLLEDASADERDILSAFAYADNEVVLHSDTSLMPQSKKAWAAWNFLGGPHSGKTISLTYSMNMLQHVPEEHPIFVTLNPRTPVDETLVHRRYTYSHPMFNMNAQRAQERMPGIQGQRNTSFAGAHLGFGFHEDGIQSAVRAVEKLGFPIRLTPEYPAP